MIGIDGCKWKMERFKKSKCDPELWKELNFIQKLWWTGGRLLCQIGLLKFDEEVGIFYKDEKKQFER